MIDRAGARLANERVAVAQRQRGVLADDLQRRLDRDRRAQGDLDGAVATECAAEAAGQHAADVAAVA